MAGMIDMHCHILPGIDDGAKDEKDALELLRAEKEQGISKVVFTPHFNPERISLDKFLDMRKKSYERLKNTEGFSGLGIETKLGAEVYYSMRLIEMDVSGLCFENTNYIMLEFPTNVRPYGITHTVQNLMDRGYTPILAHVERYGYFPFIASGTGNQYNKNIRQGKIFRSGRNQYHQCVCMRLFRHIPFQAQKKYIHSR